MKQSELFTKTRREAPADEVSKNAILLTRAGFIHKEMAGVYSLLPLGLRVVNNINTIIREEMNAIGGQEVYLSALQDPEIWKTTDRWDDEKVDTWFKTSLRAGGELGLGFTHEEALTRIMKEQISSYRDLPKYAYQIQTKFRNEPRAKSGVMRGREFLMKDLYSFSRTAEEHEEFYHKAQEAYRKVFERAGLGDRTFMTFASGGVFSKYSHEFQTLCETGEDTIHVDTTKKLAVNHEVLTEDVLRDLGLNRNELTEAKAVEVGNIFSLGTRFSDALGLSYRAEDGTTHPVVMGSYGIGPTRLMGTIVEVLADDKGMVWPKSVAPFPVHVVALDNHKEQAVADYAQAFISKLEERGIEALYDDRDLRTGEKFADADLIGIPLRVVISAKTIKEGKVEVKGRTENDARLVSEEEALALAEA